MRICIVIPLWKRPEVTEFCFDGLKKLFQESQHDYKVVCAISEDYYREVCENRGFDYIEVENHPLGAKINAGIKRALSYQWDYLMMMNSDDIVSAQLIDCTYRPFFDKLNPYFGINRVTYVNFETREARSYRYDVSILGIAKMVSRETVERLKGELYRPDLNSCLDDTMLDRMAMAGIKGTIVEYEGELAWDFKSETNIHPWEKFKNRGKVVQYAAE